MLETLTPEQVAFYKSQGYLVLENWIPISIIENIRTEINRFQEQDRQLKESNDCLDLEDSLTLENPRIRRIKLPHTKSNIMRELMYSDYLLSVARDLIGPDLRLHSSKLNMKSAGYGAAIDWHKDFAFYPHTNDDVLATGVMIDDYDERILCGSTTLKPRMADVPVRLPQPQPEKNRSIYEIQAQLD